MELDVDKFKKFASTLIQILKNLETETLALRTVVYSLTAQLGLEGSPEILVQAARNAPNVKRLMDNKYDEPLAQFLGQVDKREELAEAFLESLRSWKPSDPQN